MKMAGIRQEISGERGKEKKKRLTHQGWERATNNSKVNDDVRKSVRTLYNPILLTRALRAELSDVLNARWQMRRSWYCACSPFSWPWLLN